MPVVNRNIEISTLRYFGLIFISFLFIACDVSMISDTDAKNIAKLRVNILIEDGPKDNSLNSVKVFLSDGKKQIINKDINVVLNGLLLDLYTKDELYHTTTSFYRTDSLSRRDSYYFEIVLPDGIKYPLAFIKPLEKDSTAMFSIPEEIFQNEDFSLKWNNLSVPHKLDFIKRIKAKDNTAENIKGYAYDDRRLDTLNTKEGEYIIPKSYFEDSLTVTTFLEIALTRKENGLTNPKLLPNSDIIYNYGIEKIIHFEK